MELKKTMTRFMNFKYRSNNFWNNINKIKKN